MDAEQVDDRDILVLLNCVRPVASNLPACLIRADLAIVELDCQHCYIVISSLSSLQVPLLADVFSRSGRYCCLCDNLTSKMVETLTHSEFWGVLCVTVLATLFSSGGGACRNTIGRI